MHRFNIGDKVHVTSKSEVFTISEVYNDYFYGLDEKEIAHLYLLEPKYENIYFAGDLVPASI